MRRRLALASPRPGVTDFVAGPPPLQGWASVGPSRDRGAGRKTGEVYALYVHPDHWGRGVARALLGHGMLALARQDFRDVTLWVLAGNHRARRFYVGAGFTADGEAKPNGLEGVPSPSVRYGCVLGVPS